MNSPPANLDQKQPTNGGKTRRLHVAGPTDSSTPPGTTLTRRRPVGDDDHAGGSAAASPSASSRDPSGSRTPSTRPRTDSLQTLWNSSSLPAGEVKRAGNHESSREMSNVSRFLPGPTPRKCTPNAQRPLPPTPNGLGCLVAVDPSPAAQKKRPATIPSRMSSKTGVPTEDVDRRLLAPRRFNWARSGADKDSSPSNWTPGSDPETNKIGLETPLKKQPRIVAELRWSDPLPTTFEPQREPTCSGSVPYQQRQLPPRRARTCNTHRKWTEVVVPAQLLFDEIQRFRRDDPANVPDSYARHLLRWQRRVARRLARQNRLVLDNIDSVNEARMAHLSVDRLRDELAALKSDFRRTGAAKRRLQLELERKRSEAEQKDVASQFLLALDKMRK